MTYGPWDDLITIFLDFNSKLNLSALRTADDIYVKHILDSLEFLQVMKFLDWSSVADVWTGGWFPLLALASSFPDCEFVGIDARRKKTEAVQSIANTLWLHNVRTVWWRVEEHHEHYDYVTARAVAYGDKLVNWCAPLLKPHGTLILYKQYNDVEKQVLLNSARKFHLRLEREHRYHLFDGDIERVIYVFCGW